MNVISASIKMGVITSMVQYLSVPETIPQKLAAVYNISMYTTSYLRLHMTMCSLSDVTVTVLPQLRHVSVGGSRI